MNEILKMSTFLELGIVPIDDPLHDFNKHLASLPPEEARAAKRKFRKMWRALAKKSKSGDRSFGLGKKEPTRAQKTRRKREVLLEVVKRVSRIKREAGLPPGVY